MPIISYDHAVTYYDATRKYPDGVPEQIRDAIVSYVDASQSTRFLEVAIGTGLIGVPFINAGYNYAGVDISAQMMQEIPAKLAQDSLPHLVQANAMQTLPFAPNTFDVVNAVRIFHLLDDWQSALDALHRVIKPSGYLIIAHEVIVDGVTFNPIASGHKQWYTILEQLGGPKPKSRPRLWERSPAIQAYLQTLDATVSVIDLCQFDSDRWSIRMVVENHKKRIYSPDWNLPDAMHTEAMGLIDDWLKTECKNPDEQVVIPMALRAVVAKF